MLGPEVGDVEALDADRQPLEAERLLERGERVDALLAAALAAEAVLRERQRRVSLRQLAQPPLAAALGDPHLDGGAAARAERVVEQLRALAHRRADDDEPGHGRRRGVVLGEELLGDLGLVAAATALSR